MNRENARTNRAGPAATVDWLVNGGEVPGRAPQKIADMELRPADLGEAIGCEPLIDAPAAARLLKVHPKTVKRLANDGILPGMRIGKLWRFRASILDAWMKAQLNCSSHLCPKR